MMPGGKPVEKLGEVLERSFVKGEARFCIARRQHERAPGGKALRSGLPGLCRSRLSADPVGPARLHVAPSPAIGTVHPPVDCPSFPRRGGVLECGPASDW